MNLKYKLNNDTMVAAIRDNIRAKLRENEIGYRALADWTGMSEATAYNYISKYPRAMNIVYLKAIADVLRVSLDWLTEEHNA